MLTTSFAWVLVLTAAFYFERQTLLLRTRPQIIRQLLASVGERIKPRARTLLDFLGHILSDGADTRYQSFANKPFSISKM